MGGGTANPERGQDTEPCCPHTAPNLRSDTASQTVRINSLQAPQARVNSHSGWPWTDDFPRLEDSFVAKIYKVQSKSKKTPWRTQKLQRSSQGHFSEANFCHFSLHLLSFQNVLNHRTQVKWLLVLGPMTCLYPGGQPSFMSPVGLSETGQQGGPQAKLPGSVLLWNLCLSGPRFQSRPWRKERDHQCPPAL